jgi:hypothetical protein
MKHCCDDMNRFVNDKRMPIEYMSTFREYHLPLLSSNAQQSIDYCPWCGVNLPNSLRDLWFEMLEDKIGEQIYDIAFDNTRFNEIPEKFQNDTWWIELNL